MDEKIVVAWNTGGYARACWHWTSPTSVAAWASAMASELEKQGFYQVEILPAWCARSWCYWNTVLIKEFYATGKEKEHWRRIAIAVEKWLITRAIRRKTL